MPALRCLLVADRPEDWAAAGFAVDGGSTSLGSIEVRFVDADGSGIVGWELAGPGSVESIDGLGTAWTDARAVDPVVQPNGVIRLDHVVIATPDLGRTIGALDGAGFEVRRTRDVPGSRPERRQVFLWAGETILEVIGDVTAPPGPGDAGPASIWGLALTTADIDAAADLLGPRLGRPKDAVQPGRRIATVDTRGLGIGTAMALMTPHAGRSGSST